MTKEKRKMTRKDIERLLAMLVGAVGQDRTADDDAAVKATYDYVLDELASELTTPVRKKTRVSNPKVPCMLLANDPADW